MRRNHVLWAVSLLLAGGIVTAWTVQSLSTPPVRDVIAKQLPGEAGPSLPLSQVVLFSSGVGYFQREGEVEGNARIDLEFPIGDVNDLLKSLVLQDLGNGKIGPIGYDGQEPVEKTLRSFSVDLTGNPTFGQLLNQARGEKVEIVMHQSATSQPTTLTGVVLGMESEVQATGPGAAHEVHLLNLVCAEGMRSVNLHEVQRVRFLNPRLEGELHKALDVLAASRDELKKQISLNFKGDGKRKVRVGYVVENPIWKTSYRLSVDGEHGKAKSKVQLQGWAAVENVTDEDWNDVRVVLLSGQPISFQMDMYPPLFVPRPTVEPETFASLRPPTYDGALTRSKVEEMLANNANPMTNPGLDSPMNAYGNGGALGGFAALAGFGLGGIAGLGGVGGMGGMPNPRQQLGYMGMTSNIGFGGLGGGIGGLSGGGQLGNNLNRYQNNPRLLHNPKASVSPAMPGGADEDEMPSKPSAGGASTRLTYQQLQARRRQRDEAKTAGEKITAIDAHGNLAAEAASTDLGGHVQYIIEDRVSLPRQKSALLPILDKRIEAKRICIYSEATQGGVIGRLNSAMQPSVDVATELPMSSWIERFSNNLAGTGCFIYGNEESLKSDAGGTGPIKLFGDESPRVRIQPMPEAKLASVLAEVLAQQGLTYVLGEDRIEILKKVHAKQSSDRLLRPSEVAGLGVGVASSSDPSANHPMLGLRVKNTTGQPLTPGPVTVYEDGVYGGDASLPGLQPNEERMVAYGLDLATEIKSEVRRSNGPAMTVSAIGDQLLVRHNVRETRKYIVRNRSNYHRLLVIEHPIRVGWDLAKDVKPTETSRNAYRFDINLPAGKDLEFEVAEERDRSDNFPGTPETRNDGLRMIHFSTNLNLHVVSGVRAMPVEVIRVRVARGEVQIINRLRAEQTYRVLNTSDKDARDMIMRHRVGQDWHVVGKDGPANLQMKDYPLKLAPGKDGSVQTLNEREQLTAVAGLQIPLADLEKLLAEKSVSGEVKTALKKVLDQRVAIEEQRTQAGDLEKRLKEIGEEQDRLRKNIANLPPTSAAYKRYLEKFDKQETEIEGLQAQVKKLKEGEKARQKELTDWLTGLNVE